MQQRLSMSAPVWRGMGVGVLVSVLVGAVYFVILREPGSVFYPFAGLAFLGGPLVGGVVAARRAPARRRGAFFAAGSIVFGLVLVLFILTYAVRPQFDRTSVDVTTFSNGVDGPLNVPGHLQYVLPDGKTGILLARDAHSAVVAVLGDAPPFPSTVSLVDTTANRLVRSLNFPNDVLAATINEGILYLFNDKLGFLLDARTGASVQTALIIDNYGGLSESDRPVISRASTGRWYMETTAVISSWHVDGTVRSRRYLTFNCLARGCYIVGDTQQITPLRKTNEEKVRGK